MYVGAYAQQTIRLYEGKASGSENWTWTEKETTQNTFNARFIYNVSDPTLIAYLTHPWAANGTAVVIAPGGAFHILSIDNEGIQVARWLNAHCIAAFILKYRGRLPPFADILQNLSSISWAGITLMGTMV